MEVSEAIARVRNYVDDQGNSVDSRWTDEEIKTSLEMSLDLLVQEAVQAGVHQAFRLSTTTALSSGQIVVPEHFKIISVFLSNSNVKIAIYPGGARNRNFIDQASTGTIEIDYVAKNNVDWTDNGDIVTYGTVDINNKVYDAYLCCLAALDLLVKEGEAANILVDRCERYRQSLLGTPVTGQIAVFPQSRNILSPSTYYQLYYYQKSPTVLEVYR
jgi:hypothetical protein